MSLGAVTLSNAQLLFCSCMLWFAYEIIYYYDQTVLDQVAVSNVIFLQPVFLGEVLHSGLQQNFCN